MKKFEYRSERVSVVSNDSEASIKFNSLGNEGWQVFFISPNIGPDETVLLWMLREINE